MAPNPDASRRQLLRGLGTATVSTAAFSSAVAATGRNDGRGGGFPPSGITTWGESAPLGDGELGAFASVTPAGTPKYVGLELSEGVLPHLPSPETLADQGEGPWRGGVVQKLHGGFWSKLHSLDFPDETPAPIEYMGFGWNSEGHLPEGVYSKPHFDMHFYFHTPETIRGIPAGRISEEDIADGQIPEGYVLIEDGAVVPNMGAHLAPEDAPEFDDRDDASAWRKTLIWGAADVDDDDVYELDFVEPMITVDHLRNHLDGVHSAEIAQPDAYPMAGWYPTAYSVRDLGDGGYAVAMEDFERRDP